MKTIKDRRAERVSGRPITAADWTEFYAEIAVRIGTLTLAELVAAKEELLKWGQAAGLSDADMTRLAKQATK